MYSISIHRQKIKNLNLIDNVDNEFKKNKSVI